MMDILLSGSDACAGPANNNGGGEEQANLQALWAKVLQVESGSIMENDSFFRLGGDSLAAIRLIAAARSKGYHMKMATIFENPRLSSLAGRLSVLQALDRQNGDVAPFSLLPGNEIHGLTHIAAIHCGVISDMIEDIYPCTALQEGLIALSQKQTGTYVSQQTSMLANVDVDRFERAWDTIVEKVPILRTSFVQVASRMLQVVVKSHGSIISRPKQSLDAYLADDKLTPMSLGRPMTRLVIVEEHFVMTAHHAIYDGWSMKLIWHAVEQEFMGGSSFTLQPYNRFINFSTLMTVESAQSYWSTYLEAFDGHYFPQLPSSNYRPLATVSVTHQFDLLEGSSLDVTLSTVIRAAWSMLLSAYSDSNSISFGVVLSGRDSDLTGIDQVAGPTISTVPINIRINGKKLVHQFLREIQRSILEMSIFASFGLQNIKRLGPSALAACGFQSLLIVQPLKSRGSELFAGIDLHSASSDFFYPHALVVECSPGIDTASIRAQFDPQVMSEQFVKRVLSNFGHIISQVHLAKREQRIEDISLLSEMDLHQIAQWNHGSNKSESQGTFVHRLIERNVKHQPFAPAICAWDGNLNYAELNALANRLARYLVGVGIGPETFVPIFFEKSMWAVVSMLAICKAGGAFVALNPTHPITRSKLIVDNVRAGLVLSSSLYEEKCGLVTRGISKMHVISADRLSELEYCPDNLDTVPMKASNAAYVVFTSGSTGIPKGVVIEHSAFAASTTAHGEIMCLNRETRALQFAAYTFDMCLSEIFTTLLYGGCVCMPSESQKQNNLTQTINSMQINWVFLTPSVARLIQPEEVPCLKNLIIGGEALVDDDLKRWGSSVKLCQAYGPTEACIVCALNVVTSTTTASTIGTAVGCRLWIVDCTDFNKLVPIGAVGELLIEGPILARGYLDNKDKTDSVFISNPAWSKTSCHLYRTGDLVCYNMDGSIRYIGRRDSQVKISGQRVELGEIEHSARKVLPVGMNFAVNVLSHGRSESRNVLTAFLDIGTDPGHMDGKSAANFESIINDIEASLSDLLPAYMVPKIFIPLRAFPLSASGKLDWEGMRRLAAAADMTQLKSRLARPQGTKQAPTNENERKLRKLWARVLNFSENSIHSDDQFFRLGGDSVLAMQLVALARDKGLLLSVSDIFDYPRLSQMTLRLARSSSEDESPTVLPYELIPTENTEELRSKAASQCSVLANQITDIYPCTSLQEGIFALSIKTPGSYIFRCVYNVHIAIDLGRFQAAWTTTIENTDILRSRIIQIGSFAIWQTVVSDESYWSRATNLTDYLASDRRQSMSFGYPLLRLCLIQDPPKPGIQFVLTVHHAIYDGFSISLLWQAVERAYVGLGHVPVPRFNRVVEYIGKYDIEKSRSYWLRELSGATALPYPFSLPLEYQPVADASLNYTLRLKKMSTFTATKATFIRAAWSLLLGHYANSTDVTFGMVLSGRDIQIPGIEKIIGPVTSSVPVRVRLDQRHYISDFLSQIQRQATDMIPHGHFGLQNISSIDPDIRDICSLQSLLVIQPDLIVGPPGALQAMALHNTETKLVYPHSMVFSCGLTKAGVSIEVNFDKAIINQLQVARLVRQFDHVLQQIYWGQSEKRLGDIVFVSPEDQQEILKWNSCKPDISYNCVHKMFEKVASRQPSANAISAWDGEFTYTQLDKISSTLARYLARLGVGPGSYVPLCFEKSVWSTVATLAVLKSGGAFVPIDATHPISRLSSLVQSVKAELVLISAVHKSKLERISRQVLVIDAAFPGIGSKWEDSEVSQVKPSNPAYIFFTSGSSGPPKGVVMSHSALATSIQAQGSFIGLDQRSRTLHTTSYTFDVSLAEMFGTLLHGGCLCVPSETQRMDNISLAIRTFEANVAFFTPSVARLIHPRDVPSLEILVLGGEPMSSTDFEVWSPSLRLVNGYGPTEACIFSLMSTITEKKNARRIGRAIGSRCWIVDATNPAKLAAVGATGELAIEGPILMQGYHNDAASSNSTFITNPGWSAADGPVGRLYLTGDIVRYDYEECGDINYIYRKDTQIKIHGQRVELGEIESKIQDILEEVLDVAVEVVNPKIDPSSEVLMAFVTPKATENVTVLKSRLLDVLPGYMVPRAFLGLDCFPKNTAGKLDRKKLRIIASHLTMEEIAILGGNTEEKITPAGESEMRMHALWAQTLGLQPDAIGAHENFFQLGGDSMAAMRLVSLARAGGFSISVRDIFDHPKLHRMAPYLISTDHSSDLSSEITPFSMVKSQGSLDTVLAQASRLCRIPEALIEDIYPATPLQEALFMGSIYYPGAFILQSVFRLPPSIEVERFKAAWDATVSSNAILRTRFVRLGLIFCQVVVEASLQWTDALNLEDAVQEGESSRMGLGDKLIRCTLVKPNSRGQRYFIWTAHHSLYDGWSLPLIFQEVENAYLHDTPTLPSAHFRDFIHLTVHSLSQVTVNEYWRNRLAGASPTSLFEVKPDFQATIPWIVDRTIEFPNRRKQESHFTRPTFILLAWALLIGSYSGSLDVTIGVTITGRNARLSGIDKMMAPTIAEIPIRCRIGPDQSIHLTLTDIQEQLNGAETFEQTGVANIANISKEIADICQFPMSVVINPGARHLNLAGKIGVEHISSRALRMSPTPCFSECTVSDEGIQAGLRVDKTLVDEEQLQSILDRFCHILPQLISYRSGYTITDIHVVNK